MSILGGFAIWAVYKSTLRAYLSKPTGYKSNKREKEEDEDRNPANVFSNYLRGLKKIIAMNKNIGINIYLCSYRSNTLRKNIPVIVGG